METLSQSLLQNRSMDVYKTWDGEIMATHMRFGRTKGIIKTGHKAGSILQKTFFSRPEGYSKKPSNTKQ